MTHCRASQTRLTWGPKSRTLLLPSNKPLQKPIAHTDVFVDDFVQLGQGSKKRLGALRNHLLHSIDQVLSQPIGDETRNEAVSIKKLLKGNSSWGTRKDILGWTLDFVCQTIELPPHRKEKLAQVFSCLEGPKRVSEKRWRRILGQLRFVAQAIPGAGGQGVRRLGFPRCPKASTRVLSKPSGTHSFLQAPL